MINLTDAQGNLVKFFQETMLLHECVVFKSDLPLTYNTAQLQTLIKVGNDQLILGYAYGNSLDTIIKTVAGTEYAGMNLGILRSHNNPYVNEFAVWIKHKVDRPGYVLGFENFLRYVLAPFENIQRFIVDPEDTSQQPPILAIQLDNEYIPLLDTWDIKHFSDINEAIEVARKVLDNRL